jgi:hypothetical protein
MAPINEQQGSSCKTSKNDPVIDCIITVYIINVEVKIEYQDDD